MKYLLFITICIFLPKHSTYCQDLANLDRKFGIKKFKLETDYALYKSQLQYKGKNDQNVLFYTYIGNDLNSIFDVPIDVIALGFYKGKLYSITIKFNVSNSYETNKTNEFLIKKRLTELFGEPKEAGNLDELPFNIVWCFVWKTNKTRLQLDKKGSNSDYNPNEVSIFMYSNKLEQQIANDSF